MDPMRRHGYDVGEEIGIKRIASIIGTRSTDSDLAIVPSPFKEYHQISWIHNIHNYFCIGTNQKT